MMLIDIEPILDVAELEGKEYVSIDFLKGFEQVDAVPVVRCRECEYYQDNNGGYPHGECRWGHDETPDADDYCSYGAKMDGGKHGN